MDLYQFNIQHLASGLNLDHSRQSPPPPPSKISQKTLCGCVLEHECSSRGEKTLLDAKGSWEKSETSKKTVCDWIKMESETSIHLPDKHIYSPLPSQALVPSGHSIGAGGSYLKGRSGSIGSKKLCCSPRPLKPGQRDPH